MSIKQKLIVGIAACMLALGLVTATLVNVASERSVRLAAEQALTAAGGALEATERADVEKLQATLSVLAAHPGLAEAFRAGDRARLLAVARPLFQGLGASHGVTHFSFHTRDREVFLRVHDPARHGDRVQRTTLSMAASGAGRGAGMELGRTAYALRAVTPWVVDGEVIGYLELGEELSSFLGRMKSQTGDDYAMLIAKRDPDRNELLREDDWRAMRAGRGLPDDWAAHGDFVVVDDTGREDALPSGLDLAGLRPGGRILGELQRGERTLVRGLVPVRDAGGRQVGGVVVTHDVTALHDGLSRARAGILVTLAAVAIAMTLVLLLIVQRLVFGRLAALSASLEDLGSRLAGGEYDVGRLAPTGPRDEIGRFEELVGGFLTGIGRLLQELTRR